MFMADKLSKDDLRKIDRTIRRNRQKKNGEQNKTRTRVERNKKAYTRKAKHREDFLSVRDGLYDAHDL